MEHDGPPPFAEGFQRRATFDRAMGLASEIFSKHRALVVGVFGLYAGVALIGLMLIGVVSLLTGAAQVQVEQMNMSLQELADADFAARVMGQSRAVIWATVIGSLVRYSFWGATLRPIRQVLASGRGMGVVAGIGQVGATLGRSVGATLVLMTTVGFGLVLCVLPGLVAYVVLIPYLYVVCARGEGLIEGLSTALTWSRRHAGLVLLVLGVQVTFLLASGCINGALGAPILRAMGAPGVLVTSVVQWFAMVITALPMWLFTVGAMRAIEAAEG